MLGRARRGGAGQAARRRHGADLRGLHPSPPVRGHWNRQAARLAEPLYGKTPAIPLHLRRRVPGGFVRYFAGGALRRLHAQRAGDEIPRCAGRGGGRAHHQLRRRHRTDARRPAPRAVALPRPRSAAGDLLSAFGAMKSGRRKSCFVIRRESSFCIDKEAPANRSASRRFSFRTACPSPARGPQGRTRRRPAWRKAA